MELILPSAYLPPISWFRQLVKAEHANIEQWENYHKQTLRNRCWIDAPNGKLALTVPIDKENFSSGGKCLMKDVRISKHTDWQRQHWSAIESSYSQSPFFEYLQDDFRPFYEREYEFLMDYNEALIMKCCELIDIQPKMQRTSEFIGSIFTGKEVTQGESQRYYQVFERKHGFQPDLSIIDLIFNMGPESVIYL